VYIDLENLEVKTIPTGYMKNIIRSLSWQKWWWI